mmetsp:Transcript_34267/g.63153  ORF Transcript_34267/g.63153 Transcript_34267/m.63153 type:complete len:151 (+) Transcript_34267:405-857(+)
MVPFAGSGSSGLLFCSKNGETNQALDDQIHIMSHDAIICMVPTKPRDAASGPSLVVTGTSTGASRFTSASVDTGVVLAAVPAGPGVAGAGTIAVGSTAAGGSNMGEAIGASVGTGITGGRTLSSTHIRHPPLPFPTSWSQSDDASGVSCP